MPLTFTFSCDGKMTARKQSDQFATVIAEKRLQEGRFESAERHVIAWGDAGF